MDDQPAFFIAHLVLEAITHTVIAKRIICGRWQQRFVEGEKANFNVGLNCTTLESRLTHNNFTATTSAQHAKLQAR
jgi:hypothetical protein